MRQIKKIKCVTVGLLLLTALIAFVVYLWKEYGIEKSNPNNYATIGDIPTPTGFERIDGKDPGFGKYLRSLPLKPKGSILKYYWGGIADLQELNYAVVDLPLLSNAEQCADVCMRLRAEYLYQESRFSDIHFLDVQGNTLYYSEGESRGQFEKYLKKVFDVANTYSLYQEMQTRDLADIQPGDVFVYPANSQRYGHAVMIVDVAKDITTNTTAVIVVEGFLPARSIHVMRNSEDSINSPWFILNRESDYQTFAIFQFKDTDLKYFPQ
jgi:hypothetical protein